MKRGEPWVDIEEVTADPTPGAPSRIRSITIFVILVVASVSGAVVAQFTASDPLPHSIGQPAAGPTGVDPLAFGTP